jgi:hypothetical protein
LEFRIIQFSISNLKPLNGEVVKITNLKWIVVLGVVVILASACSSAPAATPPATRAPTQTPWIIYVPITSTPEPAVATILPTSIAAAPKVQPTATRTTVPVKASSSSVKVVPTATKAPVVALSPTPAPPVCTANAVALTFPENGTIRKTKDSGPASDTFDLKWTPFQQGEADPLMGYHIELVSKVGNKVHNSDSVDVQHNFFWNNGLHYIYDAQRVFGLGAGASADTVSVTWTVTVIKIAGSFDNRGRASGTVVNCSPPSAPSLINLKICEGSC